MLWFRSLWGSLPYPDSFGFLNLRTANFTLAGVRVCGFWQTHRVVCPPPQSWYRIIRSQNFPHAAPLQSTPPCTSFPRHHWSVSCSCSVAFSRKLDERNSIIAFWSGLFHLAKCVWESVIPLHESIICSFYCWINIPLFRHLRLPLPLPSHCLEARRDILGDKNDTITAGLGVLWILVSYLSLPVPVDFFDSPNKCCIVLSGF